MRWIGALALVVALLAATSACASSGASAVSPPGGHTASGPLPPQTQAKIRQIIRRFMDTNHTPGVLVGSWSPKGTFVSATGVADLDTGTPLSTDMQFKIGSQTKVFTATLILQLVGEGKVSLNDHISTWVAGVPNGDRITIRELLNHTSGLAPGGPASPAIRAKLTTGWHRSGPARGRRVGTTGRGARREVVLQQLRLQPARAGRGASHR